MNEKEIIIDDNKKALVKEVKELPWVIEDGTWDDNKYWDDTRTWND